jgi:hypothetical protein
VANQSSIKVVRRAFRDTEVRLGSEVWLLSDAFAIDAKEQRVFESTDL